MRLRRDMRQSTYLRNVYMWVLVACYYVDFGTVLSHHQPKATDRIV